MSDFKVINYDCFDKYAVVTFLADGKIYSRETRCCNGARHYLKRDWCNNRPDIERHAIGVWLANNYEKVSERTCEKMHTFIHSN